MSTLKISEAGAFFRDALEAKLAAFNPWMSLDAVRSVVETLDALPATIEGNRELLAWLRGARRRFDAAVIDWVAVGDPAGLAG